MEILLRVSEFLRCFLKGLGLISLESWLSFPELFLLTDVLEFLADLAVLSRRSKDSLAGEGVNAGPGSGMGKRRKASWELISRTIASWSVSNVG